MAEAHLDHPGEVSWFAGCGPKHPVGPCPHACDHNGSRVVGWGPDHEHYCLIECPTCGCRSWTIEYDYPWSEDRPKYRQRGFVQVTDLAISQTAGQ